MAVLDEDFGTDLTLVEGNGVVRSCPVSVLGPTLRDLRSLYERERARADRARADAGEARAEELRWAEVASRSHAGAWKSRFKACRGRLSEAVEETKEARRAARDVPSLQAEVARLETLLSEAGIGSNESSKIEALRKEVARLRKALTVPEAREGAVGPRPAETRRRHTALEQSPDQKDTIRTLRKDITRLNNEVVRRDKRILQLNKRLDREKQSTETIRETARKLSSESLRLHREVRILGDSEARARSLSDEVFWLRYVLVVSKAGKEKLKARLVKLRAAGATLSKLPCDEATQLRAALRRSRRKENARRKENPAAQDRAEVGDPESGAGGSACQASRDQEGTRVRACRASSGQEDVVEVAVRCRRRSPQGPAKVAASEGHDQVPVPGERPAAQGREDIAEPDRDAGSPAGEALRDRSSAVESALRPQERAAGQTALGAQARPAGRRARPRPHPAAQARGAYRRAQPAAGCVRLRTVRAALCAERRRGIHPRRDRGQGPQAGDPPSALAPDLRVRVVAHGSVGAPGAAAVPQDALRDQLLGALPVRALCLLAPRAPGCRVDVRPGAAVSPGTLANSPKRFVPLFEPMAEAILAHQSKAALRHADETSWRVQELRGEDRSSRAWLWTSVSSDAVCFHIDPSRSAEAAHKLFAEALPYTVIVCDRYSAYKRLVRLLGGLVILAFCWSHVRRDFIECAAGQVELTHGARDGSS